MASPRFSKTKTCSTPAVADSAVVRSAQASTTSRARSWSRSANDASWSEVKQTTSQRPHAGCSPKMAPDSGCRRRCADEGREPVLEHDDVVVVARDLGAVSRPRRAQGTVVGGREERAVEAVRRHRHPLVEERVVAQGRRVRPRIEVAPVHRVALGGGVAIEVQQLASVGEQHAGAPHRVTPRRRGRIEVTPPTSSGTAIGRPRSPSPRSPVRGRRYRCAVRSGAGRIGLEREPAPSTRVP